MKNILKNKMAKAGLVLTSVTASSVAFAQDYTTQITAASTEGNTNVLAVIGAVIGIAILGFGVGSMLGWFKR
ncbi:MULTISPECIES: hypothetical protein [unclassified Pseudoalteromonas]|uniref:hypothetical protein n=1 Tax=unclassified Pseudoalteromonas TaxID=194690 RepID=UPI0005AB138C|nr:MULTISPECIES: hypothetical protein [unclassified Pseudoalteromonas]